MEANAPPPSETLVDHFFRIQSGKMISVLVRILGRSRWETCEEIVQETLLKAFQVWSMHGPPENPGGWLMTAARNRAIDEIRKERRDAAAVVHWGRQAADSEFTRPDTLEGPPIDDDQLRLLVLCCDPRLNPSDRVALTLKMTCGLSYQEIANALLVSEETIRKRVYRAREALKLGGFSAEKMTLGDMASRLESVLDVLYLVFNEGYKSTSEAHIRVELCQEALRLAQEVEPSAGETRPQVNALMALMYFQMCRFPTRTNADGSLCPLAEQDRSRWDRAFSALGFHHFQRSARGTTISRYHLEAAIASHHCAASHFDDTDWRAIEELYAQLSVVYPSPLVDLNRAIAIGYAYGAEQALERLDRLGSVEELATYSPYYASLAEFYTRAGKVGEALDAYQRAEQLCGSEIERQFYQKKRLETPDRPLPREAPSIPP